MPALLAAAEAGDVGHHPHRQRQRRDDVAVGADDDAGVLPLRIELEHQFVLVVGAARGAEAGEQLAFDRGDVGRLQSDGGAEVVMRLRVARAGGDARFRQSGSPCVDGGVELVDELGAAACAVRRAAC